MFAKFKCGGQLRAGRVQPVRRTTRWSPALLVSLLGAALLQPIHCETSSDATLVSLAVVGSGYDRIIDFRPQSRTYWVSTTLDRLTIRIQARDPSTVVTYQLTSGEDTLAAGLVGNSEGEFSVELPFGLSEVRVNVTPPGGRIGKYLIAILRSPEFPCTIQGVLTAMTEGPGPLSFDCEERTSLTVRSELVFSRDVALAGEGLLVLEGSGFERVMSVAPGVSVGLIGIEITNGSAAEGGGLYNQGDATLVDGVIASNEAERRGGGIYTSPGSTLTLQGVAIERNVVSGTSSASGGGIYADDASVIVRDSVIDDNLALGFSGQSGRIALGGGILASGGELLVEGSRVEANAAFGGDASGEFSTAGSARGAGMHLTGVAAAIRTSTLSGNVARGGLGPVGGGLASGGGLYVDGGAVDIESSTIDSNVAEGITGRFPVGAGGGLYLLGAELVGVNLTISGNRSQNSEAISSGFGGSVSLYNSTVAFHSFDGTHSVISVGDSEVTVSHSIFWNSGRCVGAVTSLGYNLFASTFGCGIDGSVVGDRVDGDPGLLPLADNGGATMTHALPGGSIAVDAGDPSGCRSADGTPLLHDQRGHPRPIRTCDVGAFELQ